MITFEQKLKAIKGSIEKWDGISKGEIKDEGSGNCPLCALFLTPVGCKGCPIYEKTGLTQCGGTPWGKFRELRSEYDGTDTLVLLAARDFRDWLKDLYIEVSEAGAGGEKTIKEIEEEHAGVSKYNFSRKTDIIKLTERIMKLETSSGAIDLISETHKIRIEKLEEKSKKIEARVKGNEIGIHLNYDDIIEIQKEMRDSKCK